MTSRGIVRSTRGASVHSVLRRYYGFSCKTADGTYTFLEKSDISPIVQNAESGTVPDGHRLAAWLEVLVHPGDSELSDRSDSDPPMIRS